MLAVGYCPQPSRVLCRAYAVKFAASRQRFGTRLLPFLSMVLSGSSGVAPPHLALLVQGATVISQLFSFLKLGFFDSVA